MEGENGRVKTRIKQALLIRGSRDFESEKDYAAFVNHQVDCSNRRHEVQHQLKEERASLRPLPETAAPEYVEMQPQGQRPQPHQRVLLPLQRTMPGCGQNGDRPALRRAPGGLQPKWAPSDRLAKVARK